MGDDARMANDPSARSDVDVSEITGFWLRGGQYVEAADSAHVAEVVVSDGDAAVSLGIAFDVIIWQPGNDIRQARRMLLRADHVMGLAVGPVVG
jgi:hypothetical protein